MLQNQENNQSDQLNRSNHHDLFVAEQFEDYSHPFIRMVEVEEQQPDSYWYQNVASCLDCNGGMARLGSYFICSSCGFESSFI